MKHAGDGGDALGAAVLGLRSIATRILDAAETWAPPVLADGPLRDPDHGALVVLGAIALATRIDAILSGIPEPPVIEGAARATADDAGSLFR